MLGMLLLPIGGKKYFMVYGGPFLECPDEATGVCMAQELVYAADDNDVVIPTRDFSTPLRSQLDAGLNKAVDLILKGEPVYVGCMGGRGRTGLFLAVLAKAFGVCNPVECVRANYYAHAVETPEQYRYVTKYEVPEEVLKKIKRAKFKAKFRWKKSLTREL